MTDKEKFINLLKEFGLKQEQDDYTFKIENDKINLYSSPKEKNNSLIKGDFWADISFNFNEDGSFKEIYISGD